MSSVHPKVLSVSDLRLGFVAGAGKDQKLLIAVDGISFDLHAGETFALLGESGCGKSATAQGLMRLLPAAGRYLGGKVELSKTAESILNLSDEALRRVRGGRMAMIFQEPATSLNPVLTVGDQIGEVLRVQRGLPEAEVSPAALALLKLVGIADPQRRLTEYPFQFSGGMKQRVMIAMALAGQPDILIADEPTTALDVTVQAQILDLLKSLQQARGMAMLLITHDLGVLATMADTIGVMYAGELVEVASRQAFFAQPLHPYSRALFAAMPEAVARGERLLSLPGQVPALDNMPDGCRFADRCAEVMVKCREQSPDWRIVDDVHRVRCWAVDMAKRLGPASPCLPPLSSEVTNHSNDVVLNVQALQVLFPIRRGFFQRVVGQVRAVDGVSLQLKAGKTLALVGESGCGKTTVGKAILQLIEPTAGSVVLQGQEWVGLSNARLRPLRQQMQMVFQDPFASLNPRMRIGEILLEGLVALGLVKDAKSAQPALETLLEQVGLNATALDRFPHEFSGGQRQRIAIARALAVQPKVMICDEPTSALDVSVQAQILNLLRDLQQSLGLAYLFITHNFGVVHYLADEVAVMYLGRIVEQGSAQAVLSEPRHPYTQALLAAVPSIHQSPIAGAAALSGDMPSPASPPAGCHFHPRCPKAQAVCREAYPPEKTVSEDHCVACFF